MDLKEKKLIELQDMKSGIELNIIEANRKRSAKFHIGALEQRLQQINAEIASRIDVIFKTDHI